MSIALDLALLIRDSSNQLNLSVANIGVAYTMAFRIGSKGMSWVSQNTLSKELGISESNIRIHCRKLNEVGILITKRDPKDKRKNVYRFSVYLVNYHQMNDEDRKKCRLKLGDTFEDTAYFQAVNTAYKQAVISCTNGSEDIDKLREIKSYPQPKGTIESNINNKDTSLGVKKRSPNPRKKPIIDCPSDMKPSLQNYDFCHENELNCDLELKKCINWHQAKGNKFALWDKVFNNWLIKAVEIKNNSNGGKNVRQKQETNCQRVNRLLNIKKQKESTNYTIDLDKSSFCQI